MNCAATPGPLHAFVVLLSVPTDTHLASPQGLLLPIPKTVTSFPALASAFHPSPHPTGLPPTPG